MLYNLIYCVSLFFVCCSCTINSQKNVANLEILKDSINDPYIFFNEISIKLSNDSITKILNQEIQKISVNVFSSSIPIERIKEKKYKLQTCIDNEILGCENMTPETYDVLFNNQKIIGLKYSYSPIGNKSTFDKYAYYNLKNGKKLNYSRVFLNPKQFLNQFRKKYRKDLENQLFHLEEDDYEYEIIKEHLEDKEIFDLEDLNNFEIFYSDNTSNSTHLRFHYRGLGGIYESIIPKGYIIFELEEIKGLLRNEFIELLEEN